MQTNELNIQLWDVVKEQNKLKQKKWITTNEIMNWGIIQLKKTIKQLANFTEKKGKKILLYKM